MTTAVHRHPAIDDALSRAVGIVGVFVLLGPLVGAAILALAVGLGDAAAAVLTGGFRQALLALPFTVISGTLVGMFVAFVAAGFHALVVGIVTAAGAAVTGRPSPVVAGMAALAAFGLIGQRDWSAPLFEIGLALLMLGSALICCWIAARLLDTLDSD